jgi:hypothetical protein
MRSIPLAMTWEMLRRGRRGFLLAALAGNALPVLLFTALQHDGAIDPADPVQVMLNLVLAEFNMFLFGTALMAASNPASRLYTFPIPTSSLVGWTLLPAMALMAIEVVATTALLNAIFALHWALWGPALFAAVTLAAIQAAAWLAEKSGWLGVIIGVIGVPLALWYKTRFGPLFAQPTHYWTEVTPVEVGTLFAIAIAAYFVGVFGVNRNRSGQPPYSVGLIAWLDRLFALAPQEGLQLLNPAQAQSWFEWRKKGWAMPGIVAMGLFMGGFIWLIANRHADGLLEGLVAGGAILAIAGALSGFILGNVGSSDSDLQFGQFLATRPITSTDLARTILKTAVKSVVIAWALWAVAFVGAYAILKAVAIEVPSKFPAGLGWWYLPAALLAAWTSVGILTPFSLTGRIKLTTAALFGAMGLFVGGALFSKFALSPTAQEYFVQGAAIFCGVVFVVWTVSAFVVARRRSLIGWPTLYVAATAWAALCTLIAVMWFPRSAEALAVCLCVAGLLALAVAPLATAPLAVAWNRTR